MIEFRRVMGHIEVYKGNQFLFSADSYEEVEDELKEG